MGIQLTLTFVLDNTVVFVEYANILAACISMHDTKEGKRYAILPHLFAQLWVTHFKRSLLNWSSLKEHWQHGK